MLFLKVQAIQSIGCGHISKIFLEFLSPWWASGEGGITLAWTNEELRHRVLPRDWYLYISHFSEVEGHPNLLACWIAGSGARIADQLTNSDVRITNLVPNYLISIRISRKRRARPLLTDQGVSTLCLQFEKQASPEFKKKTLKSK